MNEDLKFQIPHLKGKVIKEAFMSADSTQVTILFTDASLLSIDADATEPHSGCHLTGSCVITGSDKSMQGWTMDDDGQWILILTN